MKKHIILAVLTALMIFVLAACNTNTTNPDPTDPTYPTLEKVTAVEPAKNADGAYVMTEPGHVAYMAEHPDQKYVLGGDIDMGGAGWTPIADFSGNLDGLINGEYNYTISNLTIQVPQNAANVGFFSVISGDVRHVIFKDIHVVSIYPFTGNLGVVAGESKTAMTDVDTKNCSITVTVKNANVGSVAGKSARATACDASGVMNITLDGGKCYVGGVFGYTDKAVSLADSRVEINVTTQSSTSGATGGTLGYAGGKIKTQNYGGKLTVTADNAYAVGTLIGELNSSLENSQNCAQIHKVTGAAQANVYCGIVGANGKVDDCLTRDAASLEINIPEAEYALRQQVIDYMYRVCTFRWIPVQDMYYDDCDCSGGKGHPQTFKAGTIYFGPPYSHLCLSLEAAMAIMNPDSTLKDSVPTTGFHRLFGNDCADSMYWAWSQISADVTYTLTSNCSTSTGIYPVGNFVVDGSTTNTCATNGAEVMYEAYAQAKMADGLLGPGHIRMVAENAYVFRDENGKILPSESYILAHEQGMPISKQPQTHTTCQVYGKYTFEQLFRSNYIPITIKAFTEGEDEIQVATTNTATDKSGVGKGTVSSNYRLNNVTIRITDSKGAVVFEETKFPTNDNTTNTDSYNLSKFQASLSQVKYTAGAEYNYEVFVFVSGENVSVQSFKFTA